MISSDRGRESFAANVKRLKSMLDVDMPPVILYDVLQRMADALRLQDPEGIAGYDGAKALAKARQRTGFCDEPGCEAEACRRPDGGAFRCDEHEAQLARDVAELNDAGAGVEDPEHGDDG